MGRRGGGDGEEQGKRGGGSMRRLPSSPSLLFFPFPFYTTRMRAASEAYLLLVCTLLLEQAPAEHPHIRAGLDLGHKGLRHDGNGGRQLSRHVLSEAKDGDVAGHALRVVGGEDEGLGHVDHLALACVRPDTSKAGERGGQGKGIEARRGGGGECRASMRETVGMKVWRGDVTRVKCNRPRNGPALTGHRE